MLPKFTATILVASGAALAAEPGWTGTLSSLDGGLAGTVKVINDTAVTISNYQLKDASAPALYWWGAINKDLPKGFRINNERVSKPASTDTITIMLDAGKTARDFSVVGLWCEKLSANFGQATLSKQGQTNPSEGGSMVGNKTSAAAGRVRDYPATGTTMLGMTAGLTVLTVYLA